MDDKTFELIEKMYSEFIGFRKDMNEFRKETNTRLDKIEIVLEHDVKNSLQSLHEGVAVNTSKLNEHTERLNIIENKVDYIAMSVTSQDKRLKVVESSGKKAK